MRRDRPSQTAAKIALNVVTLGSNPATRDVLPAGAADASARLLVAAGAASETTIRVARQRWVRGLYMAIDRVMPGQFTALGHRKAFCERQVREAIAAGASQVLVLGAGYDTLGWRLAPEFPHVAFFEIDHPATARAKSTGIERLGTHANLELIAADLGKHGMKDLLTGQFGWKVEAPSVLVAEGVLMYLAPESVAQLFRGAAAVAGGGSRIAFTYVPRGSDGRPDAGKLTGFILWSLRVVGEPWRSSLDTASIDATLASWGWRHAPELVGDPPPGGVEAFAVAVR